MSQSLSCSKGRDIFWSVSNFDLLGQQLDDLRVVGSQDQQQGAFQLLLFPMCSLRATPKLSGLMEESFRALSYTIVSSMMHQREIGLI